MSKKVLICPLNWGLGHATRCIPVIRELEKSGCEVLIGGDGASLDLLKIEFPTNRFFELPSYDITYSGGLIGLALQVPKILRVIKEEHREVSGIIKKENISHVISDNRYGCYHETIPSAIIIHQLSLRVPLGGIANRYNESFIKRFNECWVPDQPDHILSGELSINKNIPHRFIGPLSRMKSNDISSTSIPLLGIVSGPEPHSTAFHNLLTSQVKDIARGLPAAKVSDLVERAEIIVSRSGYSTIMDLAALKKKAIFVPTPGQPEQLYLAKRMHEMKIAPMFGQRNFNLTAALEQMQNYTGFVADYFNNNLLQTTLREFLG